MTKTTLPKGYGVAHLADGRYYPLYASDDPPSPFSLTPLYWQYQLIPFARGPQPVEGVASFTSRKLAEDYCWRQDESFSVLWNIAKDAWARELFPERNAWYRDQLTQLVRQQSPYATCAVYINGTLEAVTVAIYLANTERVAVECPTIDDAIATLYHEVYERIACNQHKKEA